MRSYSSSIYNALGAGYTWSEYAFTIDLSQEEIQFMYYSLQESGNTSGLVPGYEPYVIVYVNGIKYVRIENLTYDKSGKDYFLSILNQVKVLTNAELIFKFYIYAKVTGAGGHTLTFTMKTVK